MVGVARRSLLQGAGVVVLAPLALGGLAAAAPHRSVGIGKVSRDSLESAVGSSVRILGGGASVTATLVRVSDVRHAPPGHPQAFTAVFHVDDGATTVLEDGLVDIDLPSQRLTGAGLFLPGGGSDNTAVLHVDRRPVSEHLDTRA